MKKKKLSFISISLLFFIASTLLVFSCKSDSAAEEQSNKHPNVEPDKSFAPFYAKFHQDSVYQMAHIMFPLQGLPQQVDSNSLAQKDFYWDKESWSFQRDLAEETGYTKQVKAIMPDMVEELILHPSGKFGIIRRFAKLGDDWYLIYFSGLNPIKQ